MEHSHDVIVVGGGLAGLVAGITALERGQQVALIEAHTLGGRARTAERDGYLFNVGAHALYDAGALRRYLDELGIATPGGAPNTTSIRVLRDGALWPLRNTATGIASTRLLSVPDRARALAALGGLTRLRPDEHVGTSFAEFCSRYRPMVRALFDMLVRTSSYCNAPDLLDAGAAIAQVQASFAGVTYIDGGWQTIVDALAARFVAGGGVVHTGAQVLQVAASPELVVTTDRETHRAGAVVLAGLAPDTVRRLTGDEPRRCANLGPTVYAASLDLALRRPYDGVVLSADRPVYLSPHAPVAALAPQGGGLVSLLHYVPAGENGGDADAERRELRALAALAGIADRDIVDERFLFRSVVAHGFPTAAGGGLAGRPPTDALDLPGVYLAGDWIGPEGMLADASAASARLAGAQAAEFATQARR